MSQQVQTLKGFRDFLQPEKRKRDFVASKVKEIFNLYGFDPIETPTLEYASLLLGKYGVEADKLVYQFEDYGGRHVALRYDQTVPTARILAQYQNELPKYFRRSQIQSVFRAEKPQKGRFREFTQCDIDIFGSKSPIADAEILACTYHAFKNVGFKNITFLLNDRKTLLETLEPYTTQTVNVFSLIQSIDKLEKIGEQGVIEELEGKGLSMDGARTALTAIQSAQPTPELQAIMQAAIALGVDTASLQFCSTLARGLDYYTGMIFEIKIPEYAAGSLGGGGRYDNLIEHLGGLVMPAVGVGMGFDRMVDAAESLGIFDSIVLKPRLMATLFSDNEVEYMLDLVQSLRHTGISVETCPQIGDVGKQLKVASQKQVDYVLIAGPDEVQEEKVVIKNMKTGTQQILSKPELMNFFK